MRLDTAFLDELASAAPVPGGGGAAAYCAALAAALGSMVVNLTIANPKRDDGERFAETARHLDRLRADLLELVEADAQAFAPVAAALKMPKDTSQQIAARDLAMQAALIGACEVPLDIMRACGSVIEECRFLAAHGSRMAASDAVAGALLAKAALLSASLNVFANVKMMTDESLVSHYRDMANELIAQGTKRAGEACEQVGVWADAAAAAAADGYQGALRGKPVVEAMDAHTAARVQALQKGGVQPCLAVLRVGENPDDVAYENALLKRAAALGIQVQVRKFAREVSQCDLEAAVRAVNADAAVHGCLLFRPLPAAIDELALCNLIDPRKDVDGVGASSLAGVFMGASEGFAPCTAQACLEMLDAYEVPLAGKRAVVVGRSLVVGRPAAMLLMVRHATVTLAHSQTRDLPAVMRSADIVVCAVGRARAFGRECFRKGQVVLDVGMNVGDDGALCGDVDFDAVSPAVAAITPVPGGVGSVTTGVLMRHVVEAAERAANMVPISVQKGAC